MGDYLLIGIGGAVGAIARYALALWITGKWGRVFPLGTFVINISGSFLIGFVMSILAARNIIDPQWRLLIVVGFLGGYTTFSAFEFETGTLLKQGESLAAMLYVALSVIVGFIALRIGDALGKSI
ncbi:fluoride efflux transporter CrcB [Candidatus Magnetominusculus dajiuhuensis]|uniref:fluoride efflux transporter CrcB n=1 Tax=Candidatus Magnetominusculus dajiuhuensis TaxID=3137712 RepID=UPI003B4312A0